MTYLNNKQEDLKQQAQSLFSDAISIRNPNRVEFIKNFIEANSQYKNSIDGVEFNKVLHRKTICF